MHSRDPEQVHLAIRRPREHFKSAFRLVSHTFRELLAETDRLQSLIDAERTTLLDVLFTDLPTYDDRRIRAAVLHTRRQVYKKSGTPIDLVPGTTNLNERIHYLNNLLMHHETCIGNARQAVYKEVREAMQGLLKDQMFVVAVNYSCPWLISATTNLRSQTLNFTKQERALNDYATRMFSKANPLHVFAGIQLEDCCEGAVGGQDYRLSLSETLIEALDESVLKQQKPLPTQLIFPTCYVRNENGIDFLCLDDQSIRFVHAQASPFIYRLLEIFERFGGPMEYGSLGEVCVRTCSGVDAEEIEQTLETLMNQGVLTICATEPANALAQLSLYIDPQYRSAIEYLSSINRTHIRATDIPNVHISIASLQLPVPGVDSSSYFVDSFYECGLTDQSSLMAKVSSDLRLLAPLLSYRHNYSQRAHRLTEYVKVVMENLGTENLPLIALIKHYLRNYHEAQAMFSKIQDGTSRHHLWEELHNRSGNLSDSELQKICSQLDVACKDPVSMCFNGPMDVQSNKYFPQNIFTGEGRMFRRYGGSRFAKENGQHAKQGVQVEIVARLPHNRNFSMSRQRIGTSFDPRYRSLFQEWLDPSNIDVALENGLVTYRHSKTQEMIQVSFYGNILADYLPTPYQFLLLHHRDYYFNPFLIPPDRVLGLIEKTDTCHIQGVTYHSVVLRRSQWIANIKLFGDLKGEDAIGVSISIRQILKSGLSISEPDLMFYQVIENRNPGPTYSKPRLLDSQNPLSYISLQRTLRRAARGSAILFTNVEPNIYSMPRIEGQPYLMEHMIEI